MFKTMILGLLFAAVSFRAEPNYGWVIRLAGYNAETEAAEIARVEIPEAWDAVYENYNALQKQGGFDLEPYKGKVCVRYTYEIPDITARGNVLVHNGRVVGGDVCSITLDGIMVPLGRAEN